MHGAMKIRMLEFEWINSRIDAASEPIAFPIDGMISEVPVKFTTMPVKLLITTILVVKSLLNLLSSSVSVVKRVQCTNLVGCPKIAAMRT